MASLIRSAKSGSDWTTNELRAFNIVVENVDVLTFFGVAALPRPPCLQSFSTTSSSRCPPTVLSKDERTFFRYLTRAHTLDEAAVNDFANHLLRMLNFDDNNRLIVGRRELSFEMCGTRVWAKPDIAVLNDIDYSLMVQEGKRNTVTDEPRAQLIAEAIAAFVENNRLRDPDPPLPQHTFPGITMVGTSPIFYKIPVTQDLVDALATAQYPAQPTRVQRLVPPVPDRQMYDRNGMIPK